MPKSDLTVFLESLKMWDRPCSFEKGPSILRQSDNIEKMVDEMFQQFCDLDLDHHCSFVGTC